MSPRSSEQGARSGPRHRLTGAAQYLYRLLRRVTRGRRCADLRTVEVRAENGTWIDTHLRAAAPQLAEGEWSVRIEQRALASQELGRQPLWDGYEVLDDTDSWSYRDASRSSNDVRTSPALGRFFTWVVAQRQPSVIVEFGTAFGVSGMYWLAGIEMNMRGRLLTFEPNETWAKIADSNLAAVGQRYVLTVGTFEEKITQILPSPEKIDIAFIDAIHTSGFVEPQFQAVADRVRPGGLVLLDDINFSADMRSCWEKIRLDRRLAATAEVERVGIAEFRR